MWVVITYDISDDKIRFKMARELEKFLDRVQKSVFEGEISRSNLEYIKSFANSLINHETDSVRIYKLCGECRVKTEQIGYVEVPMSYSEDEVW